MSNVIKIHINRLLHIKSLKDIVINNVFLLSGNNTIADIIHKKLNGIVTHTCSKNSVLSSRRAATLNMTENTGT